MTDTPAPSDHELDVEAEQARLDQIGKDDAAIRAKAEDDLEVGGSGRTFSDAGVRAQVEEEGDTDHPTGDGTGEH